jgi:hypothetical protein
VVALSQRSAFHESDEDASQANFAAAYRGASDRRRVKIRVPVSRALHGQRTLRLISLVRSLECACECFGTGRASRVRGASGECYTGFGSPDIACCDYLVWASMMPEVSWRAMYPQCSWGFVVTTPLIAEAR